MLAPSALAHTLLARHPGVGARHLVRILRQLPAHAPESVHLRHRGRVQEVKQVFMRTGARRNRPRATSTDHDCRPSEDEMLVQVESEGPRKLLMRSPMHAVVVRPILAALMHA